MYTATNNKPFDCSQPEDIKSKTTLSARQEEILSTLLKQDRYGLSMIEAIEQASGGKRAITPGSLYPMLQKLEDQGLVESYWGDDIPEERRGARRRYYKLTEAGREAVVEALHFRAKLIDPEGTATEPSLALNLSALQGTH